MENSVNKEEVIPEFKSLLKNISNIDASSFKVTLDQSLDPQGFYQEKLNNFKDNGEPLFNLFKQLNYIDISKFPLKTLIKITEIMKKFIESMNFFKSNFEFSSPFSRETFDKLESLCDNYSNWFESLAPIISYYNNLNFTPTETHKRIDEILTDTQAVAAKVSVEKHANNFKDAAEKFNIYQEKWLATIVVTIAVIIGFSIGAFWYCPIELKDPYLYSFFQAALPRFTGLIGLFYWLVICSRNYRAQSHNYIVNNNKYNALCTFETFVKATDDEEIKNAVLLQTTKAIFSNSASGYLKNDSGDEPATQVVEIVKGVSKILNK